MAECQAETEELLRSRGEAGDKRAEPGSMEYRDSYEYLTIRGAEFSCNLLAVRCQVAESLELLHFEKIYHGEYKKKPSRKNRKKRPELNTKPPTIHHAYSRVLIGRVTLQQGVGFLGKSQVVAVIHFNNNVANKNQGFKEKHTEFMEDLVEVCSQFDVRRLSVSFAVRSFVRMLFVVFAVVFAPLVLFAVVFANVLTMLSFCHSRVERFVRCSLFAG